MGRCNGCYNASLKGGLRDRYLLLGNTVYQLDAEPLPGQSEPLSYQGRPIRFRVTFAEIGHSYDEDCQAKRKG